MLSVLLVVFVSLVSVLYVLILVSHGYWRRRNVPQPPTTLLAGNIGDAMGLKKHLADVYADIYNKYERYSFVGIYKIFNPTLLIRDLELIKEVVSKQFSNFTDNTISFDESDPLIGKNPFVLNGQKWKSARTQLTPLFTSLKVKSVVSTFNIGAEKLVEYIREPKNTNELNAKDIGTRYSIENVVSYALGLEAKSFENDNSEFIKISQGLFQSSIIQTLIAYIAMVFPGLTKYLKLRLTSSSTEKSFTSIVSNSIKYRLENNIVRNDFLNSLLSMKKASTITDHDIMVAIGGFYLDGIETSALVLSYLLYELAAHPWAQEELKKEIDEVLSKHGGVVTYEAIQEMKYLDAVFNESLRLHPPLGFMDRNTTQKTNLSGSMKDGKQIEVSLEVGTSVIIPIKALHYDENHFPEPHAFKPERFLPDNKDSIPKYAFLPFGEGPRICLGKVFGTTQVKVGAIHVLKNYRLSLGSKTSYPVELDPNSFILYPKEPMMIKFMRWN